MKIHRSSLFPPVERGGSTLALRPLLIAGMIVPVHDGDGGVNIQMHEDNPSGLLAAIDPYQPMSVGDKHDVFWSDMKIAQRDVLLEDVDKRLFVYLPKDTIIPEWGERVHYTLTRSGTNIPQDSTPLRLRVKLDRPAGTDKDPHLPGHSELQAPGLPQDVIDNGVDAEWAARGVPAEIQTYLGRAAWDTIQLKWGSVFLTHQVTPGEAAGSASITILVDQAAILAAGDSDSLLVHYQVFDEVWNYSTEWSLQTRVAVDAGAWRLDAPIIKEAVNGTIDLDDLGRNDATVQIVLPGPPYTLGDSITMTWIGTPATGLPVTHTETVVIGSIPSILQLYVPNADVRAIAGGSADASYVLKKLNGDPPQSSKRTFANVVGDVSQLPAPTIRELIGDVLEPDTPIATVLIPVYPGMDTGDVINMIWMGTKSNGTPYVHEHEHPVTYNDKGKVIPIYVPNEHIVILDYGTLDLYYTVTNDQKSLFGMSESDHTPIKIERVHAELPAPKVVEAPNDVLDPALVPDSATLLIEYLGTNPGDILTYYWTGRPGAGTGSDWVPITTPTAGKPITFRIDNTLITPNIGSIVKVRYSLKLKATGNYKYSATLDLTIGSLVGDLPEPQVLEAPTGVLDPMDALAGVVARARYDSMDPALDVITLKWLGTPGAGTSDDQELPGNSGGYVDFSVAASVVGPNIGKHVDVSYEVQRYGSPTPSLVLDLTVSNFKDPDNELPRPRITQANDASKELNLNSFTGNAGVTVGKWPFSAQGQRVWLRLVGTGSTGTVNITVLAGVPISAIQASNGLNEQVIRSELEKLTHNTALTVTCKVTFDGSAQEASAIEFPVARYTFKTFDDSVVPTIDTVTDAGNNVIPPGGTTYFPNVTLAGKAAPNQRVQIYDGATAVGQPVLVNGTGDWTLPLTGLAVASHSITAKGLYGSEPVSVARVLIVATATVPTIDTVTDAEGVIPPGGTTYFPNVTLAGKAAPNQRVQIYDGATAIGQPVLVNGTGDWTLPLTGLAVASHSITAKGFYGSEPVSVARVLIVATATVPAITSVRDTRGEVANGGSTTDTSVNLTGTAAANQQVEIFDGAASRGRASVTGSGGWNSSISSLALGGHSLTAKGLYGSQPVSNARTFTVQSPTPPLVIDTSPVTLSGIFYIWTDGRMPPNAPVNTSIQRGATGGVPPYRYQSSNAAVASVTNAGLVRALKDGATTITVSDNGGSSKSYQVTVTNGWRIQHIGNFIWNGAIQYQPAGGHLPRGEELQWMRAQYGSSWPHAEQPWWSSDELSRIDALVVTIPSGSAYYTMKAFSFAALSVHK
ncbi:Ig-like domain-containing protein [Pseudomonas viridiflava]|uniref:Ig-like domain-containing protein n=1 Tax=Pseudomonas viridiflava TaxID=33069 RepID=UPI000F052C96|nr:Ig-like domain-containing protein [Pseudomonas viridiflava]